MQPVLAAFGVALALPDRHARLDLVDDVATGGEGGVAVRGGDADPDRDVADHQVAGAVHAARVEDVESLERLGQHALRSEEHTSELQSLMRISYAVFCLKKKNKTHQNTHIAQYGPIPR